MHIIRNIDIDRLANDPRILNAETEKEIDTIVTQIIIEDAWRHTETALSTVPQTMFTDFDKELCIGVIDTNGS